MQLGKGDQLFKFIGQFRYNWIEDSPPEFLIEISSIKVEFQENKAGEITTPEYLLSIVEIVNSVHEVGTDALLLVKNYVLGLIWGIDYIYIFLLCKVKMRIAIYRVLVGQFFYNLINCTHWEILYKQLITICTHWLCTFKCDLEKFKALSMAGLLLNVYKKRSNCQQIGREIWVLKKENISMNHKRKSRQFKTDMTLKRNP